MILSSPAKKIERISHRGRILKGDMVRQRQLLSLGILLLVSLLGERNALGAEIQESLAGDSHGANGSGLGGTHAHDVEVELQGNRGSDVGPWLTWFLKWTPPIASQLVFLSPMDAMRKIQIEGTTSSMTATPYASMLCSGTIWVAYGVLAGDATIWLPNVTGFLMASYYMFTFHKFLAPGSSLKYHYMAIACIFSATVFIVVTMPTHAANIVVGYMGVVIVIVMFSSPLSVIQHVIQTRNTASLPPLFTFASFLNCVLWVSYGYFVIHDAFIYGPNSAGLVATSAQIALFAIYGMPPPGPAYAALKVEMKTDSHA